MGTTSKRPSLVHFSESGSMSQSSPGANSHSFNVNGRSHEPPRGADFEDEHLRGTICSTRRTGIPTVGHHASNEMHDYVAEDSIPIRRTVPRKQGVQKYISQSQSCQPRTTTTVHGICRYDMVGRAQNFLYFRVLKTLLRHVLSSC